MNTLSVYRPEVGQTPEPMKVADGPALVEDFIFDHDGTRYRVVVVSVNEEEAFVLAEPVAPAHAGPRRYLVVRRDEDLLAQSYVAEKLGFEDYRHTDCQSLTILIAHALGRDALLVTADGQYQRRVAR